jgi:hypothetical protein
MASDPLREQLRKMLDWEEAHVPFDHAIDRIPPEMRCRRPEGAPYSPWELVEHLRITQHDILDFCRNPRYQEIRWPDDYWPSSQAPADDAAWDESIARYRADREAMQALVTDESSDLFARIPHGSGQTYIREALLVFDHASYHLGELVLVRRLLGIWNR